MERPARLRRVVFRSGVEGGEGGEGRGPIHGEVVLNHCPGLFADRSILVEPELFDALEATGLDDGFGVGMTPLGFGSQHIDGERRRCTPQYSCERSNCDTDQLCVWILLR